MSDDVSERRVEELLEQLRAGDESAFEALVPIVYDELRQIARAQRRRLSGNETLNTTAIVHEAYLKLEARSGASFESRAHLLSVAARAMRQVLIDYARARKSKKRGGGSDQAPLDAVAVGGAGALTAPDRPQTLVALDAALERLASENERHARIVECRFFAGMTIAETSEALAVSPASVKRGWLVAKAWLYRDLQGGAPTAR